MTPAHSHPEPMYSPLVPGFPIRVLLLALMGATVTACGSDPAELASLSEGCSSGADCSSGFCESVPDADQSVCSECGENAVRPQPDGVCAWSESDGAHVCAAASDVDDSDGDDGDEDDFGDGDGGCGPDGCAAWNPNTCRIDDDGSSAEPGDLAVSSRVLAEDSDPTDNIDDGTTVYYPSILETSSCKFKVIGWGNGSTGTGGSDYPAYFNHLASHGFVVAVAHTNLATAEDKPILTSIGLVMAESDDPSSVFYQKVDPEFGLMGKSLGATAVARELSEPDAVAGVLIASGSGAGSALSKPGLFATGDSDFLRQFVAQSYEAATGEAIFAQAAQEPNPEDDPGAGHMDMNDREGVVELATSFMRCHLRQNADACNYVSCESCQVEPWSIFETKEAANQDDPGGNDQDDDDDELPIEAAYSVDGPFATSTETGPDYHVYHPTEMTGDHSVITWGNSAGGRPGMYRGLLQQFASWGFVVVATTSNSCRAADLIGGVDLMADLNDDPSSVFHNQLDLEVVGASGHSLGGGCAIGAANEDSRIQVVGIGNPAPQDSTMTEGSMFIMGAADDPIANPMVVQGIYDNSELPTIAGITDGGSHFVYMANGGAFRGYATAWFMTELRGDSQAEGAFYGDDCEICRHPDWSVQRKNLD